MSSDSVAMIDSDFFSGDHQGEIEKYFKGTVCCQIENPVFEKELILIAFTNRCGSNLLVDYMRQTGMFGGGGEFFNFDVVSELSNKNNISSMSDYVKFLYSQFAGGERYLMAKSSHHQMAMLIRMGVHTMFPSVKVVYVYRDDVISQAVSFSIAAQNKRWTSEQVGVDAEPKFNYQDIFNRVKGALAENQKIQLIISALGLDYVKVRYESVIEDRQLEIDKVCEFVGISQQRKILKEPKISKQATEKNDEFCALFRSGFNLAHDFE